MSDNDLFTVALLAPLALPVVLAVAATRVDAFADWLINHGIVVPPDQAWLSVPGLGGVGLDITRTLMLLLLLGGIVSAAVMVRSRRVEQ